MMSLLNSLLMSSTKALFIKEDEKMASDMEKASKSGMTDQSTRDNGRTTWPTDTEDSSMQMGMFTRGSERRTKPMELGGIFIWTELNIKVIESMISRKGKEQRLGQIEHSIRDPT